ncbi:hypothetical protein HAX54_028263, partial [Datura stramonium]|nr:hypothetical protein [Datura stramonium]
SNGLLEVLVVSYPKSCKKFSQNPQGDFKDRDLVEWIVETYLENFEGRMGETNGHTNNQLFVTPAR